MIQDHSSN